MIFQIEKNSMMMKVGKKKHRTCVIFKKISVAQISSRSSHFFGHTHNKAFPLPLKCPEWLSWKYLSFSTAHHNYSSEALLFPPPHLYSAPLWLPTTQEMTLHMDITRWLLWKSDWLYSLQLKVEKLYTFSRNKTGSWLWLRSWTPYCKSQT